MRTEQNWASRISFRDKLRFFFYTGEYLGFYSKKSLEMFMEGNIQAELEDGKIGCARLKLERAREIGLEIDIPEAELFTLQGE